MGRSSYLWTYFSAFICFVIGIFGICQPNSDLPSRPGLTSEQIARIDSVCTTYIERGQTIGFSIGIAYEGTPVYVKGYGQAHLAAERKAGAHTIYPIASISKMITAVTTLKMMDEGLLQLQDKVIRFIPNLPDQEYMQAITIEHLLRHQSGLIDHEDWMDSIYINHRRAFSNEEFLQFINRPLLFQPGTHFSYSNSGFYLLSEVLETIDNQDFHTIIRNRIGKPHDLSSLGMWPEMWHKKEAALGYQRVKNNLDTSFHMMTKSMKGDGGLSASVADLLAFARKLTKGEILSDAAFQLLRSTSIIDNLPVDYCLGLTKGNYAGQPTYGHSGGYKGTGWSNLTHYPESGYTFTAMINTNYSPDEVWTLRHLVMPIVLNLEIPEHKSQPVENASFYVGEYAAINRWGSQSASRRIVIEKEGHLFWDNPDTDAPGVEIFPIGSHQFTWNPFPFDEFKFHIVDDKVVAISEYYDGTFSTIRMKL